MCLTLSLLLFIQMAFIPLFIQSLKYFMKAWVFSATVGT